MRRWRQTLAGAAGRTAIGLEAAAASLAATWRCTAAFRRALAARPLGWASLAVALFCPLSMALIDRPLALALRGHLGANWEGFFKIVTNLGLAELYLIPAGLAWLALTVKARRCLVPAERAHWRRLAWRPGFLFLAVAATGLIENAVKIALGRTRPRLLFDGGLYGFHPFSTDWAMNSFPSGHSQAAWAAMTALVILVPRYDLLWLLVAALVATSRVVTTVHFLSDAVAGSWLGLTGAVLIARALAKRGIELR